MIVYYYSTSMKGPAVLLLFILFILVLLAAGCTQSGPETKTPGVPLPASTASPAPADIAIQATSPQTAAPSTPTVTVTEVRPRGTMDPDFVVDIAVPEKIAPGTTIFPDNHNAARPRVIEVNRLGEIVWEYPLPPELISYTNPGWDVEVLPGGNILMLLPRNGVYEINRDKQVVWKYLDSKVSHDADRLANGNTLVAFGAMDTAADAQVKEIDSAGKIVWSWHAKDLFTGPEYSQIQDEGWSHTNAVTRLDSGNTLVSLRNFNVIVEVDPSGKLVRTIGKGLLEAQHDPLVLVNGTLLLINHGKPHEVLELDPATSAILWRFPVRIETSIPVRDANLLPNGNILITEADRIVEVTKDKQVVWQFRIVSNPFTDRMSYASRGFYKAERISV